MLATPQHHTLAPAILSPPPPQYAVCVCRVRGGYMGMEYCLSVDEC